MVLDLGEVPAADHFPAPDDPGPDPLHPLAMWLCPVCGLAQLVRDDTSAEEPLAVEPQALRDQAEDAVARLHAWGPVAERVGGSVREFGSPHGGSWLGLLEDRGWRAAQDEPADLVVDTFGLMHEEDQAAALRRRVDSLADDGVLVLVFHSLATIVTHGQWSSLRHGHVGYYSTTALAGLLEEVGLTAVTGWTFDLYAGTIALAATRAGVPEPPLLDILGAEADLGVTDHGAVRRTLQGAADEESEELRSALAHGGPWHAYGAASRAVAVLQRAGATPDELVAVADASPGKQGRTLPGSRIPIISPEDLVAAEPARVWLLLPDLRDEVEATFPGLRGRWSSPLT
ncbi:transferase [Marmoricola endophyticus]|uniref:Transferase n=1 Tax=Marmoricola endophyticus TaxID=2040280 RepID=A0A917F015_9ACTN|nr:transferase [Marmoricola endophyticus]